MKIIIINGSAESGKDTFVDIFRKISTDKVKNLSTVDRVKDFMIDLGWDRSKDEKSRQTIYIIKKIITDFNDGIFIDMIKKIKTLTDWHGYDIIFVHCREPEEIEKFVNYYGKGVCKTLLITRSGVKKYNNNSDKNVNNYDYDYKVLNSSDLSDLENQVKFFINWLNGY